MKFLRLREWAKYQHYRNRNPPWIKLHGELLGSFTWVTLDDDGRLLAMVCMLLAARTGNKIPLDRDYIQRAAYMVKRPDIRPLVDCGFAEIIDDGPETIEDKPVIAVPKVEQELALASDSDMLANSQKCLPRVRGRVRDREEKEKDGVHPTLLEVIEYCKERNNTVDPEKWLAYYEANGWYVGRNKMKSWRSAVRYWERNGFGGPFNDGHKTPTQLRNERSAAALDRAFSGTQAVD